MSLSALDSGASCLAHCLVPRIAKAHSVATGKEVKQLKGGDKTKVTNLQVAAEKGVLDVVRLTVKNEVVPFLDMMKREVESGANFVQVQNAALLGESACILQVQNTVHVTLVKSLIEACNAMQKLAHSFATSGSFTAEESQTSLQKWFDLSKSLLKLFMEDTEEFQTLDPAIRSCSGALSEYFGSNVHQTAFAHLKDCLIFASNFIANESQEGLDFEKFNTDLDQCRRLTSVMGENGKSIRQGLAMLDNVVTVGVALGKVAKPSADDDQSLFIRDPETVLNAMSAAMTAFSGDNRNAVISSFASMLTMTKSKLSRMEELKDLDFEKMEADLTSYLDGKVSLVQDEISLIGEKLGKAFEVVTSGGIDCSLPDVIVNIADMQAIQTEEMTECMEMTFADHRTKAVLEGACQLEKIEDCVSQVKAASGIVKDEEIFDQFGKCVALRRDFLTYLRPRQA